MDFFHWDTDPVVWKWGALQIRWYGILFVGGLFAGLEILKRIYRREGRDPASLDILLLYMIVGIVVGARLTHALVYEPDFFLTHPAEILYIWHGGLASHGGILGAVMASWLFCKKYGESFLWLFSRMMIPGVLVGAFIRIGNFFNSEIIGKVSEVPWAIIFDRIDALPRHPVMLYESAVYFAIFLVLTVLYRYTDSHRLNQLLPGTALTFIFSARIVLEYFKVQQADYTTGIPLNVGQLLSIPWLLVGIFFLLRGAGKNS
jgi:prolipoprotein diacylglyceryl transferase